MIVTDLSVTTSPSSLKPRPAINRSASEVESTTSAFLAEGNIDVLQLHISPMIIGPGINSFSRPGVHSVAESVRFQRHLYQSVGDGVMFVGRVAP